MLVVFAILTLIAVLPILHSGALDTLKTPCGHNVTIPQGDNATELLVNVTVNKPQPQGTSCSWVIPSPNSSASNQILLIVDELASVACGTNTLSLFEWDPRSSQNDHHLHPLTLYCSSTPPRHQVVVSRPGFAVLVSLNTTSALPEEFPVFVRLPTTSFADLCPETGRKVIDVPPGVFEQHGNSSLNLNQPSLLGRIPDNMTCRWEFRSRFGEAVVLRLKTYFGPYPPGQGVCPGNDTLLISDEENSDSTITIPYCKDPGVDYVYTGITGKVFVTLQTDDTGGAYRDFSIYYWILDSCPTLSYLGSVLGQEEVTLTSVLPVLHSDAEVLVLETRCVRNFTIPQGDNATTLLVNVTFGKPQPQGASCSWVIPSPNSSASNQIWLIVDELASVACGTNTLSLFEWDPRSSLNNQHLHPLTLYCSSTPPRHQVVVSRPGFAVLVSLNTTSALPEEFPVFVRLPTTSFADLCPETGRKVIDVPPGVFEQHGNSSLNLNQPSLLGRIPDNMTCRWEFRSRFGEAVVLRLKTYFDPYPPGQGVCPGNDTLLISDEENSDSTITIPYCKDPGVDYVYTGVTGKVFVTLQTDDTGGAYRDFSIHYWILDSCPTLSYLGSVLGQEEVIKGISNGVPTVGQNTSCCWVINSPRSLSNSVVMLTRLQVDDQFQQNCDVSQDYLLINGKRKISLCSNSSNKGLFPIWSESVQLKVTFHSQSTSSSRSFLLYYTGVKSGQCQGHPQFELAWKHVKNVALHPIQAEDISEGSVCQWLFKAVTTGYVVQVELTRANSDTDPVGVEFNEDTCVYDSFSIYNGDAANDQTKINATCSKTPQRGSLIRYTSSSRNMLFVYRRDPHVPESGFVMEVRQIRDPATSGGSAPGNKMTLSGMHSVMLFFCFVLAFLWYV